MRKGYCACANLQIRIVDLCGENLNHETKLLEKIHRIHKRYIVPKRQNTLAKFRKETLNLTYEERLTAQQTVDRRSYGHILHSVNISTHDKQHILLLLREEDKRLNICVYMCRAVG